METSSACGKIILFGEHAVVYGRPTLAVPLSQLRARATVAPSSDWGSVVHATDLHRVISVEDAPQDDPLATIVRLTLHKLGVSGNLDISIASDIPVASGLGSGAAISTAIVRALSAYFSKPLTLDEISALVFETEKLYHGMPSGIDNTVVAYEQPIRFVRGGASTPFQIARSFMLLIANTGIASPTKVTVGDVRRGWEHDKLTYEATFDWIGALVTAAQDALARGENDKLGELMTQNQRELETLGVSSAEIERVIEAGLGAGAAGGKLSGGGRGGNVIFYVEETTADAVRRAVSAAGAVGVIVTTVGGY